MKLPNIKTIDDMAMLYKVFGDTTRLSIMLSLRSNELCVNEISKELKMTISAISHQLRILKNAHLVKTRKDGKQVFYSLDDDHVERIIACGLDHVKE